MRAPAPTTTLDTAAIERLDFTPTLPCEHAQHAQRHDDEPAKYLVEHRCPDCGDHGRGLMCQSGWDRLARSPKATCRTCGYQGPGIECLKIVAVLP